MDLEEPDEQMAIIIKKEIREQDPDRVANNLKLLEEWMNHQPHLPKNYDKRILLTYLRGCKHDMEKAKRKLQMYFISKTVLPELFSNRNPKEIETTDFRDTVSVAPMTNLTPEGYRVTVVSVLNSDVSKFKMDRLLRTGTYIACLRTIKDVLYAGDVLVYDCVHMTAAHIAVFMTPLVRKCLIQGPEAYPNRLRQIHIVNAPMMMEKLLIVIKGLLKEKIRNRIMVHSKIETLSKYIPAHCLPCDYGGTEPPSRQISDEWFKYLMGFEDWFKSQETVKLIGPVPEEYKYEEDYGTGTEGSFRKLAID